mmetsp:Transcript_2150/g.5402  ORF Transcript_2150/g.5402 Transcript_2150/m.5402 type:complete len:585 (+) Transcript_2150:1275-3029(+)
MFNKADPSETEEYFQITDMLLAAGYFRARLPSLKPFDKILGGMAWCLTAANEDVNIEFSEDMSMGRKLALSERVVSALRQMNCPFSLSPHQIQGLDYSKLFPVIQWLVKSLLASQSALSKSSRAQTLAYFETAFHELASEKPQAAEPDIPERRFRFKSNKKLSDPVRVLSAIAEFNIPGKAFEGFIKGLGNKFGGAIKNAATASKPQRHSISHRDSANLTAQSGHMYRRSEMISKEDEEFHHEDYEEVSGKLKISPENMAKIMSGQSSDINAAMKDYQDMMRDQDPILLAARMEKERWEQQISSLRKQITVKATTLDTIQVESTEVETKSNVVSLELQDAMDLNSKLKETIANLEENTIELKAVISTTKVSEIEALVAKRTEVREQQIKFKEACEVEFKQLEAAKSEEVDPELKEWFGKVQHSFDDTNSKYQRARAILAQRNQEVALLQRKLESTPSKTELVQYQRRFVEVYDQINLKVEENRKHFDNYNSLLEIKRLLTGQYEMLISFQEAFKNAKKKADKDRFGKAVGEAIQQVRESAGRAAAKLLELKKEMTGLEDQLKALMDEERMYYQLVNELQEQYDS